jgi:hypothetical protein
MGRDGKSKKFGPHYRIRPKISCVPQTLTGRAPIHPKPILHHENILVLFLWTTLWEDSKPHHPNGPPLPKARTARIASGSESTDRPIRTSRHDPWRQTRPRFENRATPSGSGRHKPFRQSSRSVIISVAPVGETGETNAANPSTRDNFLRSHAGPVGRYGCHLNGFLEFFGWGSSSGGGVLRAGEFLGGEFLGGAKQRSPWNVSRLQSDGIVSASDPDQHHSAAGGDFIPAQRHPTYGNRAAWA